MTLNQNNMLNHHEDFPLLYTFYSHYPGSLGYRLEQPSKLQCKRLSPKDVNLRMSLRLYPCHSHDRFNNMYLTDLICSLFLKSCDHSRWDTDHIWSVVWSVFFQFPFSVYFLLISKQLRNCVKNIVSNDRNFPRWNGWKSCVWFSSPNQFLESDLGTGKEEN